MAEGDVLVELEALLVEGGPLDPAYEAGALDLGLDHPAGVALLCEPVDQQGHDYV